MKKFLLIGFLLFSLVGCSSKGRTSLAYFEESGKIKVLSTTAMIDDLVAAIGGERIDHMPLIQGESDPHNYELVKGDDEKILIADLVIANGLSLEHGASLQHHLKKHTFVVYLGEEIKRQVPDQILTIDGELDPHVWMDISLWANGIDPIVAALSKIDPEGASYYQENGDTLREEMQRAHNAVKEELEEVPVGKRFLVTSHDAFRYFARAYLGREWDKRCMAPEGLAPEGQLSSSDIQRVVSHLQDHEVVVVFPESNVSRSALIKIISSCVHSVRICTQPLYGDAMGGPGSGAETYLKMIQHNARVLRDEWNKDTQPAPES